MFISTTAVSLPKSDGTVFIENQLLHIPHPAYSPDFALSDFWPSGVSRLDSLAQVLPSPKND
jgi:hypothetical protein